MRIHTDLLSQRDLYAALPDGVHANVTQKGSRKRDHAFEATLYLTERDDLHRRYGNSGGYGASDDVAATWDEWGIWIDRLFAIDPSALIGPYESRDDFQAQTSAHRNYVRSFHKQTSLEYRTHTAPWLSHPAKIGAPARV